MGCGRTCTKYLVFFFNLIFVLAGLTIMILGIIAKIQLDNSMNTAIDSSMNDGMNTLKTAIIAIIVFGVIVFVIAFFGCCGAIKEDVCMLTTFGVVLLILFIVQVALGAYMTIQLKDEGSFQTQLSKALVEIMDKYDKDNTAKEFYDQIQTLAQCCGVKGPLDWHNSTLPASCCHDSIHCYLTSSTVYKDGCEIKVFQIIKNGLIGVGIATIVVAAIELLGSIMALFLANSIKNNRQYYT